MTTLGLGAWGRESVAVTKIEWGVDPFAGTLLNGRVLSAVHSPESINLVSTVSRASVGIASAAWAPKSMDSAPSTLTTSDKKARFAPRLISITSPEAGDV